MEKLVLTFKTNHFRKGSQSKAIWS